MSEFQLLILVAVIALATGFALGGWIYAGRNPAPTKSPASRVEEEGREAVLRVWRDPIKGRLLVGIQGEQAKFSKELSPKALDALRRSLEELGRWAGVQHQEIPGLEAIEQTASGQLASATLSPASVSENKSTRLSPADVVAQAVRTDVRKPEARPVSIAAQIDEILQENLAADETITRAVRLLEIPGKGMVVMVGLDQYAGVDEVPDEGVRTLIQEAVAEWERRVES